MEGSHRMKRRTGPVLGLLVAAGLGLAGPAAATTLMRVGLERLVAENSTVMIGEVVETRSYWNADGSFILTDVVVEPDAVLKGERSIEGRRVLTLMGGQVDDLSAVVLGGATLEVGRSYLLFSSVSDLPGSPAVATVKHHSQGVFELNESADGSLRAVSQAAGEDLVADGEGRSRVPGGIEGMALDRMLRTIEQTIQTQDFGLGVSR